MSDESKRTTAPAKNLPVGYTTREQIASWDAISVEVARIGKLPVDVLAPYAQQISRSISDAANNPVNGAATLAILKAIPTAAAPAKAAAAAQPVLAAVPAKAAAAAQPVLAAVPAKAEAVAQPVLAAVPAKANAATGSVLNYYPLNSTPTERAQFASTGAAPTLTPEQLEEQKRLNALAAVPAKAASDPILDADLARRLLALSGDPEEKAKDIRMALAIDEAEVQRVLDQEEEADSAVPEAPLPLGQYPGAREIVRAQRRVESELSARRAEQAKLDRRYLVANREARAETAPKKRSAGGFAVPVDTDSDEEIEQRLVNRSADSADTKYEGKQPILHPAEPAARPPPPTGSPAKAAPSGAFPVFRSNVATPPPSSAFTFDPPRAPTASFAPGAAPKRGRGTGLQRGTGTLFGAPPVVDIPGAPTPPPAAATTPAQLGVTGNLPVLPVLPPQRPANLGDIVGTTVSASPQSQVAFRVDVPSSPTGPRDVRPIGLPRDPPPPPANTIPSRRYVPNEYDGSEYPSAAFEQWGSRPFRAGGGGDNGSSSGPRRFGPPGPPFGGPPPPEQPPPEGPQGSRGPRIRTPDIAYTPTPVISTYVPGLPSGFGATPVAQPGGFAVEQPFLAGPNPRDVLLSQRGRAARTRAPATALAGALRVQSVRGAALCGAETSGQLALELLTTSLALEVGRSMPRGSDTHIDAWRRSFAEAVSELRTGPPVYVGGRAAATDDASESDGSGDSESESDDDDDEETEPVSLRSQFKVEIMPGADGVRLIPDIDEAPEKTTALVTWSLLAVAQHALISLIGVPTTEFPIKPDVLMYINKLLIPEEDSHADQRYEFRKTLVLSETPPAGQIIKMFATGVLTEISDSYKTHLELANAEYTSWLPTYLVMKRLTNLGRLYRRDLPLKDSLDPTDLGNFHAAQFMRCAEMLNALAHTGRSQVVARVFAAQAYVHLDALMTPRIEESVLVQTYLEWARGIGRTLELVDIRMMHPMYMLVAMSLLWDSTLVRGQLVHKASKADDAALTRLITLVTSATAEDLRSSSYESSTTGIDAIRAFVYILSGTYLMNDRVLSVVGNK